MSNVPDTRMHQPPHGCVLKNDDERDFWNALMKSRLYDDWSPLSLHSAFKILRQEFIIRPAREHLERLIAEGAQPLDNDSVANSIYTNITKAERAQLTLIRALGLTYTAIQSKSTNEAARKSNEFENEVENLPERTFFALPDKHGQPLYPH